MSQVSPLKLAVARGAGSLIRAAGRGGGTSLPGKLLLSMQDDAIERLVSPLENGTVVISATNGKTTTASLLSSILREADLEPVHNHAGANMPGGIASSLLSATRHGTLTGDIGLFEVDEAWVADLVGRLQPRVIMLANLFRDQLDRYGELETLADSWAGMIASLPAATTVVLNADDPLLAQLAGDRQNVIYFGIEDRAYAESSPRHAADSKFCRQCGAPLSYDAVLLGHLGHYQCVSCGAQRPRPSVYASNIQMNGMSGSAITIDSPGGSIAIELPIPGLYNVYNAVAATAAACALELPKTAISGGLREARAVFGRVESISVSGHEVALLLIKNPTGANEVLRTIAAQDERFDLWIALNDKIADGRDVSWVWDADFEELAGRVNRVTCSGTRAPEMALRLAYAGVDRHDIVVDDRIEQSFDSAVAAAAADGNPVFALPTYTSLLDLRTAIAKRGEAPAYWSK
ncbi:MAG: DUF1727 domain-containing protein [Actinobacteria bacterium]|nr:DUF1727 domain-containing protein [Actinomycetota bacterium]